MGVFGSHHFPLHETILLYENVHPIPPNTGIGSTPRPFLGGGGGLKETLTLHRRRAGNRKICWRTLDTVLEYTGES